MGDLEKKKEEKEKKNGTEAMVEAREIGVSVSHLF